MMNWVIWLSFPIPLSAWTFVRAVEGGRTGKHLFFERRITGSFFDSMGQGGGNPLCCFFPFRVLF